MPLCDWDIRDTAGWASRPRSNEEFIQQVITTGNPIHAVPGFHFHMVMCDIMHIALLGICQLLCASVIWELLQERHWPEVLRGTWQNRMDSQLAVA